MFTKITTIYKNKENQYKRKIYSRIFMLYGLKRLATFRKQQEMFTFSKSLRASVTAYFQICDRTFQYISGNNFN